MAEAPNPNPPPAPRTSWLRGLLLRLALLALGVLLALLLGELALRLVGHEGPTGTFRDREVGRRFARSWSGEVLVEEAGRPVHLAFNAEGVRDRDWPARPAPGALRVAVLGDSMVAALATDAGQRFTALESLPRAAGAPQALEVQNWGVSGSSPALATRLLEARVLAGRPHVALLCWFVGNDLSDDWPPLGGRRFQAAVLDARDGLTWLPLAGETSPASEWLACHSRLYTWQKRMLDRLGAPAGEALRPGLRALEVQPDPLLEDAWRMAGAVIARFAQAARAGGAQPALLVIPCAEQAYDDLWEREAARARPPGERGERWAASARVLALAAGAGCVARAWRPPAGLQVARAADHVFLGGTGHLNDRGHALLRAELLALLQGLPAPAAAPEGAR
ncbi:MAG: hypothetical protein ACKOSS_10990 [Planctomycetia bacterium]